LNARMSGLLRYSLAASAPGTAAAAQFVLQLALLRFIDATAFGQFAFVLGLIQFGYGLSNALIATPYTININGSSFQQEQALSFFTINLIFSVGWGAICGGAAAILGVAHEAWLFALLGFLAMIRWFGRAHLYALHRPIQAAASDLVYSLALVVVLAAACLMGLSLAMGAMTVSLATIAGLSALGSRFLAEQFRRAWGGSLRHYGDVWRQQSRWTLLGVISSEATANSHAYAVTFFAGPAAFAPIAATSLFVKPIALALTSLTQLERPAVARSLAAADLSAALHAVRRFRVAVLCVWSVTIAAGVVVLAWYPQLLFKSAYELGSLSVAFSLWAVISLLQCWSTPSSILLQAAQWFRPLAVWGVACAALAILAVIVLVLTAPPIYSLFGIVLGQAAANISMFVLEFRLKRSQAGGAAVAAAPLETSPVL
jgi:O-antigen/teichoic acid export membrane protein